MAEMTGAEVILVKILSEQLGMGTGGLAELDAAVRRIPGEQLAIRLTSVLTGLTVDETGGRSVSASLAGGLGGARGGALWNALKKPNAVFLEPMQQLVILRRCLTVQGTGEVDVSSEEGLTAYFDACRYAADALQLEPVGGAALEDGHAGVLTIAASFILRMSLMNPPHPTNWIARLRLMFRELPNKDPRAKVWTERLQERLIDAFGLSFSEITQFVAFLSLWANRYRNLDEVFVAGHGVALNLDSWLSQTHLSKDKLITFFERTARRTDRPISDTELGGPLSILAFRDRPFLQFVDGGVAPVHPGLVSEKLTYDLFWWAGTPDKKQDHP